TPKLSPLSLHDALPILSLKRGRDGCGDGAAYGRRRADGPGGSARAGVGAGRVTRMNPLRLDLTYRLEAPPERVWPILADTERLRSEEHTSELQSLAYLV